MISSRIVGAAFCLVARCSRGSNLAVMRLYLYLRLDRDLKASVQFVREIFATS